MKKGKQDKPEEVKGKGKGTQRDKSVEEEKKAIKEAKGDKLKEKSVKSKGAKETPSKDSGKESAKKRDKAKPPKVSSDYNIFMKVFGNEIIEKHGEVEPSQRFQIIADAYKKITEE